MLSGFQIGEGKLGPLRALELVRAANEREVAHGRVVARQQQMIAIVDDGAEAAVVIGAASPAGLPRRLVNGYATPPLREADGRGQARKPRAYDVGHRRH